MLRQHTVPRADWQHRVASLGLVFHSTDDAPYWDENVHYEFRRAEIDLLEEATQRLDEMCLEAIGEVFEQDRLGMFQIPTTFHELLHRSWQDDERTIYGRFDLSYDGRTPPKLLEYNADTPTALLEAAVIQWHWLQDTHPQADQFNTIHERLIEAWKLVKQDGQGSIHFAGMHDQAEDFVTVTYLRDTASQAGLHTNSLDIGQIGYDARSRSFVDLTDKPLECIFKLYPWEWMLREPFGAYLSGTSTRWLEPPWKMLLSNKIILVLLWELFPDNPHLLPASLEPLSGSCVRKPVLSREGCNIRWLNDGAVVTDTDGPYEEGVCVYQQAHRLPCFENRYPVIGSWMVNGHACGIGIREDATPITQNLSRFVPHLFR
jgi:glutathionylspermidine synthase